MLRGRLPQCQCALPILLVEADAFGADMIVLTTGRQGWLKRATGGGLGERILRVAPVPVLLVRGA